MDAPSSSDDVHHVTKQEQQQELTLSTNKSLPYHSLLLELHILDPHHEIWTTSIIGGLPLTRQDIWTLQQEVKLQQMIFMLLQNYGLRSGSLGDIQTMAEIEAERIQKLVAAFPDNRGPKDILSFCVEWKSAHKKFLETSYQKIKPHLKEFCLEIVDRLLQGKSSTTGESSIFAFVNVILLKLKHFMKLKPHLIDNVKNQMQILEQMLNYAPIIVTKTTNLDENLQNFLDFFEPWVNTAAAIVIPYWVDENDEKPFSMVSSTLHKFNLNIQQYVKAYILVIKALRPSNASEILVMRNTVEQVIEIILEIFIESTDDQLDMFREGLAFWMALVVDPPKSDVEHEKLICSQAHLLLGQAESLICSMCPDRDVAERRNTLLSVFLEMINKAKAEVRQLQVHQIPGWSWNNAPKAITRGGFDLLLGNLQKKFEDEGGFFPFEKHLIAIVHQELSLLRHSLLDIVELQDEHKDLRDIWVKTSNIAYIVDYLTDFSLASADIPIWSNMMHLSNTMEKIEFIKSQVSKIRQNDQGYDNIVTSAKLNSQLVLPARQEAYDATIKDDFKVGFVEEEERIIDFLVARDAGRDIVAVIGMGGQGKTHLAQRVFQDIRIKHHFHKLAWCCISQAYDIKKVFRDILEGVGEKVSLELYQSLTEEDLADKLRKCLMGQKYLIVLDDMWDAKVWFDFQESFPNTDGSRILLTSRNLDVALKVKANCSIVELNPLTCEESWSLLQMKVFNGNNCPPTLSEIGKAIAKNCKGLPLAIVVVAGLLKKDRNLESWKQICESLKPLIATEGCMDIIDLSYKHLPDYLKPCFLYLGAFEEDERIDAKQLIQLWIAEGFVQFDGKKTMEILAREYLMELVSRSLVLVTQRSSRNGIKKCHVHDLVHQLCQIKVKEDRFLLVSNGMSYRSPALNDESIYDYCRIVLGKSHQWNDLFDFQPLLRGLRSFVLYVQWYNPALHVSVKEFKLLSVLDLSFSAITKTDFYNITQLIHLRLLAVVCRFPIPPSIVNLLRLEVLRLPTTEEVMLPSVVFKMASLRHIFVTECVFDYIDCYDQLVSDTSPLTNLETLSCVVFKNKLSFLWVAQSLQHILKLGLECYYFCFHLSSYFKRLESLRLQVFYDKEEVISPSKLDFPLTLKKLNLVVKGRLSGAMLSLIGKLSHLEVLKLETRFESDTWDVEDDEFLLLKYLDFKSSSVQEWNASDESFPCLEQLIVRKCRKLEELPDRFGFVTTLRRIEVSYCSNNLKNSFQQIVDDQMDAGNEGLQYSFQQVDGWE